MAIYYSDGSDSSSGRVIQIVTATSSTYTDVTSGSFTDFTNQHVDITPKGNGNRIIGNYTLYMNNRDADTDSRIAFRVVEGFSGTDTTIYYPNLSEGESSHAWICKVNGSGSTDTDFWQPYSFTFIRTLPSSGRAGNSHRFRCQASTSISGSNKADHCKTLGFYGTLMEVSV